MATRTLASAFVTNAWQSFTTTLSAAFAYRADQRAVKISSRVLETVIATSVAEVMSVASGVRELSTSVVVAEAVRVSATVEEAV